MPKTKSKTKKHKVYEYFNDTYGFTTYLFIGEYTKCVEWMCKKFNYKGDDDDTDTNYCGLSWVLSGKDGEILGYFIWMPKFAFTIDDYVTLSHESLHTAVKALHHRGIVLQGTDTEQLNYLQDAVYRTFLTKLKRGAKK